MTKVKHSRYRTSLAFLLELKGRSLAEIGLGPVSMSSSPM